MITCDTNILIYAIGVYQKHISKDSPTARAAALMVNQRKRLGLTIPSVCIGEIIHSPSMLKDQGFLWTLFARIDLIPPIPAAYMRGARLRRLLKRGPNALNDCIGYAQAAIARSTTHFSYDKDLVGQTNRIKIPARYTAYYDEPAPALRTPLEHDMKRKNPPRTEVDKEEQKAIRFVKEWRARARRRAREAGMRTDMEIARYFAELPFSVGLG